MELDESSDDDLEVADELEEDNERPSVDINGYSRRTQSGWKRRREKAKQKEPTPAISECALVKASLSHRQLNWVQPKSQIYQTT